MMDYYYYCYGLTFVLCTGKSTFTTVLAYMHTTVCFVGLAVGFMTCLPVMGTMISNAADADQQGLTQGTTNSIAALFRALGPFVAGSIFSFSVTVNFPYLLFWFLGSVNIACLVLLRALPAHAIARVSEERPAKHEMRPLTKESNGHSNNDNKGNDDEAETLVTTTTTRDISEEETIEIVHDRDVKRQEDD